MKSEVAKRDADKQRTGDAKLNRAEPDLTKRKTEDRDQRNDHDGIADVLATEEKIENHMLHLSSGRCSVGNASSETALLSAIGTGATKSEHCGG